MHIKDELPFGNRMRRVTAWKGPQFGFDRVQLIAVASGGRCEQAAGHPLPPRSLPQGGSREMTEGRVTSGLAVGAPWVWGQLGCYVSEHGALSAGRARWPGDPHLLMASEGPRKLRKVLGVPRRLRKAVGCYQASPLDDFTPGGGHFFSWESVGCSLTQPNPAYHSQVVLSLPFLKPAFARNTFSRTDNCICHLNSFISCLLRSNWITEIMHRLSQRWIYNPNTYNFPFPFLSIHPLFQQCGGGTEDEPIGLAMGSLCSVITKGLTRDRPKLLWNTSSEGHLQSHSWKSWSQALSNLM